MRATNVRMALLAGLTVVAMACSGSEEATSETLPPPSSETSTTTSSSTTTTTASTTSESTTTVTFDEVETAVRAAHTRVMTELFAADEVTNGPGETLDLFRELTVDPILSREEEGVQTRLENGERLVGPGYDSNIAEVTIEGDLARVLDCSRDPSVVYDTNGEVLIPGSPVFRFRTAQFRLIDRRWMLEDLFTGGDERCDPADYS